MMDPQFVGSFMFCVVVLHEAGLYVLSGFNVALFPFEWTGGFWNFRRGPEYVVPLDRQKKYVWGFEVILFLEHKSIISHVFFNTKNFN